MADNNNTTRPSLYDLHQSGTFLLVNVHDVGSAALAQAAGAQAVATTSGGHAYTIGRRDAVGALNRDESIERAAAICAAVDIPVSIDAENGWGHSAEEVAETVKLLIDAGAAGASIEDWSGNPDIGFYEPQHAVERIAAAVETASAIDDGFVICARADRMTHDGIDAFDDVLARLQAFAEAGAGCLYAPGTNDLQTIARLVEESGGPINALLAVGGTLSINDVQELGVRRVSIGSSLYQATMGVFDRVVRQMLTTGSLDVDTPPLDWETIEASFPD